MLSKKQIKFITSLKNKKSRKESGLFVAEGTKIVPELLSSSFLIHSVYATETWISENNYLLAGKLSDDRLFKISDKELEKISNLSTPNEVVLIASIPEQKLNSEDLQNEISLIFDEIKDPGNLGTIIRIADWFGIKNIICSENSVDVFNSKVIQSTMGSVIRVSVFYKDLKEFLTENKNSVNIPVYGAILNGENIYRQDLLSKGLLLFGNESRGISEELIQLIDHKITIPSFGGAESLNISVAAAIICSEFKRKMI